MFAEFLKGVITGAAVAGIFYVLGKAEDKAIEMKEKK